jgi:CSLREA domain-containing protein
LTTLANARTVEFVRVPALLLAAVAAALATAAAPAPAAAAPAAPVAVALAGPASAAVGKPFALTVRMRGDVALRGFEGAVAVPRDAVEVFGSAPALAGMRSLPAVEGRAAVWFGGFARSGRAGGGPLARIVVRPTRPGTLVFRLGDPLLVTGRGARVVPRVAARTVVVRVGAGRRTWAPAAPAASTARTRAPRRLRADLDHDGAVTGVDVQTAIAARENARLDDRVCRAGERDPNRDGCTDVADIVAVARHVGESEPVAMPRTAPGPRSALAAALEPAPATFVVDTVTDAADAAPGDGVCAAAAGRCTLRAAIDEANRKRGRDFVHFAIPGPIGGVRRIVLGSQLPLVNSLNGGIVIDGYTQPGASPNTDPVASNAAIRIELQPAAGLRKALLYIASPDNEVRGLAFLPGFRPITLAGANAHGNRIVGNWVGMSAAATGGSTSNPWGTFGTGGVFLDAYAHGNFIGTPALADRNVVSGNPAHGIYLNHEFVVENVVQNNIVGLAPSGDRAIPNMIEGIDLNFGAQRNIVGGTGPNERNVASGNGASGIEFSHGWNYALAPRQDMSDQYNVKGNIAVGNYVGLLPDGRWVPSIGQNGGPASLHVQDVSIANVVEKNWVAGGRNGIRVTGDFTRDNVVRENTIGITPAGVAAGATQAGVLVDDSAVSTTIAGNVIANHAGAGVRILNGANDRNTISRNAIYANGGPGIELGLGANDDLAAPVIARGTTGSIDGTTCGGCTVEVFAADGAGSGRLFVAAAVADVGGVFSVAPAGLPAGTAITATATDGDGDTSMFAPALALTEPPAADAPIARDDFARAVNGGWGVAPLGGAWRVTASAADYTVATGEGVMLVPAAGATREAYLDGAVARDIEVTARVAIGKIPNGAAQFAYVTARRDATGSYRAQLRTAPDGHVYLALVRSSGSTSVLLAREVEVPGATAGAQLRVRFAVAGAAPATLHASAWIDGTPEPASWLVSASDADPERQGAGLVGVRAYLAAGTANAPVRFRWDDISARPATP